MQIARGRNSMLKFVDTYNSLMGMIAAVLAGVFGQYWFLFAVFLLFNVLDWLTGWYKARTLKKESSKIGFKGLLKKLGYWAIIIVAFSVSFCMIEIGNIIGLDLSFTVFLGWFTLASLMINEARSICENLVETGYNVPMIFVKGLEIYDRLIEKDNPIVKEYLDKK